MHFSCTTISKLPTTNINVDGLSVPVVIDCGATVNIADIDTYYKLCTLRKVEILLCPLTFGCLHMVQQFH
jgi:hypothetical protein